MGTRLDSDSLTRLYNENYDLVYRTIAFRVGDQQVVEDLTSDVFTRLLVALKRGNAPDTSPRGWLLTVARNVVADHYRKQSRRQWTRLSDWFASDEQSPDQQTDQQLQNAALRQSVNKLPKAQQEVLALRFGYGMPIREVAQLLEKSEGAVKMLQARGVAALAREMQ